MHDTLDYTALKHKREMHNDCEDSECEIHNDCEDSECKMHDVMEIVSIMAR